MRSSLGDGARSPALWIGKDRPEQRCHKPLPLAHDHPHAPDSRSASRVDEPGTGGSRVPLRADTADGHPGRCNEPQPTAQAEDLERVTESAGGDAGIHRIRPRRPASAEPHRSAAHGAALEPESIRCPAMDRHPSPAIVEDLASDDHFVEVVFRQVELGVGVGLEELLDGPIGIDVLHRVAGRFLGLNGVAVGHVVTAEAGIGSGVPGMEEREHTAAGTQGGAKPLDHRPDQMPGEHSPAWSRAG